jgi:hypothetical protein
MPPFDSGPFLLGEEERQARDRRMHSLMTRANGSNIDLDRHNAYSKVCNPGSRRTDARNFMSGLPAMTPGFTARLVYGS